MIEAKVIADSQVGAQRITTMEVTMHRYVLAEFNTHRVFSRNSASSRAIPVAKQLARVANDTAWPVEWGANQSGMQAGAPLEGWKAHAAKFMWKRSRNAALRSAKYMNKLGVHKQVTNRLLEPFMWHTVIVTSTEWKNFFEQRCSPLAQPEIRVAAEAMREAYEASVPEATSYHLPYLQDDEKDLPLSVKMKICVARCARVSYLTHDGVRDLKKDLKLFTRLTTAEPPHWSPLEHVAVYSHPGFNIDGNLPGTTVPVALLDTYSGNFSSAWGQLRHNLQLVRLIEESEKALV